MIAIHPLTSLPEVRPGADLVRLLREALAPLGREPDDTVVVTQKIVSKAEGRFVDLADGPVDDRARELAAITGKDPRLIALILLESVAVVRAAPGVLITRHRSGHVMANAGIDRSNLGTDHADEVLLLPRDADATAAHLAEALDMAVVISDSFGRPWRHGVVNVAIGAAGMPALHDRRGEIDRDGRTLEVTQVALADLVASAAGLAMGEGVEGVPAALVRGLVWGAPTRPAAALVRAPAEDLFR